MKAPIHLALVWHFHQPDYTDPRTGAPAMPWTRLHALKDYADMAAHLERHPGVRATFNVVPTLLDQLTALASPDALPDPFLAVGAKPAGSLTPEERRFLVAHFFSLQRERMAAGLRRFDELAALRGGGSPASIGPDVVAKFDEPALRDLQVLFHLAWSGSLLQADPVVAALRRKGRGYDEQDKAALFERQRAFLTDVVPRWRRLYEGGGIEISASPYYHPILPLLCDVTSAREALPGIRLPDVGYRHPEDADLQLTRASEAFERTFGRRPAGGWPSEGAISAAALARMAQAGYRWAASDEDVLFASLGESAPAEARRADLLYRAWRHADGPVLLFRDHDLSDRIGFTYATRRPAEAARDFVDRLRHLREILPDGGEPRLVSVILDGENAWEHFPDHGAPFFDAFYGAIAREPAIRTVTASEAAEAAKPRPLPRLCAGSWIFRNLATWVGHPEKNRAWERLAAAREAVASRRGAPSWDDPAWRAIFAAEGSDWFWWYGDDHPTEYGAEFDAGFRDKLRRAYVAADLRPPALLDEPIRGLRADSGVRPSRRIDAVLDGRVTDYFEWHGAGVVTASQGVMQAVVRMAREMRYGTDGRSLFVRLDPIEAGALDDTFVTVRTPARGEDDIAAPSGGSRGELATALDRVLEVRVPLSLLATRGGPARFAVELRSATGATQRIPSDGFVDVPAQDDDPARFDWSA
jgi:alpha-amylase/alpha-mannosidase (GH57 family)